MEFNLNIWEKKYKAPTDNTIEDTFRRVANAIADNEAEAEDFYGIMASGKFLPGGRILAYAGSGKPKATLSNCYVAGTIVDSMAGIMEGLHQTAETMRSGGGVGHDFSSLRPHGADVHGTGSISSGPVSFMGIWNEMSKTISGVGDRKGAMMGIMRVDHPDIEQFVEAKKNNGTTPVLEKFNISVGVTDAFMVAVLEDKDFDLVFDGRTYKTVRARELWSKIISNAHAKGEPGVVFLDTINTKNNLWYCETITATNPCGEQPLPPFGACTLGSINLTQFIIDPFGEDPKIDFVGLKAAVNVAVRFLDNTVDKNYYPLPQQQVEAQTKRRVGLGVMGLGSALAMLKVRYGTDESREKVGTFLSVIRDCAYEQSIELSQRRGAFALFKAEKYLAGKFIKLLPEHIKEGIRIGVRNSHLISIAPTGSIAQLVGNVSGGVEPIFAVRYKRKNYGKEVTIEDYSYKIYKSLYGEPEELPEYFVSAQELTPDEHFSVMEEAQNYVDSAISKTINLPQDISLEDTKEVYLKAWKAGLKGCTIYRDGSIDNQVLSVRDTAKTQEDVQTQATVVKYVRPYELNGKTYKVKLPDTKHSYYLTFNYDSFTKKPVELFINTKDPQVEEWTKAFGRLISAVFRNSANPEFLVEELKQIYSKETGFFSSQRRKFVPSLVAEFGEVMNDFFCEIGVTEAEPPIEAYIEEANGKEKAIIKLAYCKQCGEYGGIFKEGCFSCVACGYNKCG